MLKNRADKNHFLTSLVKSAFRICTGIALIPISPLAGAFLIIAEILGIVEELVI